MFLTRFNRHLLGLEDKRNEGRLGYHLDVSFGPLTFNVISTPYTSIPVINLPTLPNYERNQLKGKDLHIVEQSSFDVCTPAEIFILI